MASDERLIVFSRYPQPGKVKTRLIPALGPAGAAELHRRLVEHTVAVVRNFVDRRPVELEFQHAGGSKDLMAAWLGAAFNYRPQPPGDLGARMAAAFAGAFMAGAARVVLVGTDCPDLEVEILARAFAELRRAEVVLGPAEDGGYYLLGLTGVLPTLFSAVNWGTAQVFDQTVTRVRQAGRSLALLPRLADLDRPPDLANWPELHAAVIGLGGRG